jgi:hypothetical protein
MTKRYVDSLLVVAAGLLLDASTLDKTLHKGLKKDYVRLKSLSNEHGDSLFTLLLPAGCKALDQALDVGFLGATHLPCFAGRGAGSPIPRLFSGMWLKVFTSSGVLRRATEIDPTFVLILRNLLSLGAKLDMECSPNRVFSTIKEFFDVEAQLPPPSRIWVDEPHTFRGDDLGSLLDLDQRRDGRERPIEWDLVSLDDRRLLRLCQQVADRVASSLGSFDPSELRPKHGPGATAEAKRGGSYKYSFPTWSSRLSAIYPWELFGLSSLGVLGIDKESQALVPDETDFPSKLVAVPHGQGSTAYCQGTYG